MSILGDKIRTQREWLGLSITGTAAQSGVTAVYLGRMERGRLRDPNPTVKTLRGIAHTLSLNPLALAAAAFEDLAL
jgi:transcriptional regulator with XRE-family HTH domain